MDNHDSQPSLEFDIDRILENNPNPIDQDAQPPVVLPQRSAAPPPAPTPRFPDLLSAELILDDQRTISTLGRDQTIMTRDDPPIAMFRASFDPDRFADEEAPSLPKYSYKQTIRNNKSGEATRKLNSSNGGSSSGNSAGSNRSTSYRDLYIVVIVLALLLLALITGLAIWLIALRTNSIGGTESIEEEESIWASPTLSPTRIPTRFDNIVTDTRSPTIAPTKNNDWFITADPTVAPTRSVPEPTNPPKIPSPTTAPLKDTDVPTSNPTTPAPTIQQTTLSPTPLPTPESTLIQRARTKFLEILESQTSSLSVMRPLGQPNTPQFHALEWLIHDPNFEDYSDARLIQRWVLATFAYGLSDADWRTDTTAPARSSSTGPPPLPQALENSWVQYTDECSWFYTNFGDTDLCDEDGLYHRIDLRSQNLVGTIPTEISLLSNHLAFLFLYDNEIHGTIPTELGLLTRMERIELTRNHLTGSIPSEIGSGGLGESLVFLGLGVNDLTGPLPTEMGNLKKLRTIGLERNRLSGSIPTELGKMAEARLLNLDRNRLSGTVPTNLWRMTLLRGLNLSFNNDLVGTIPFPLCEQRLTYLEADCDNVECPCCTTCN